MAQGIIRLGKFLLTYNLADALKGYYYRIQALAQGDYPGHVFGQNQGERLYLSG